MKYNNILIVIVLCLGFTSQTNYAAQSSPNGWWNWATRQAQTAKQYATSGMASLSSGMTTMYNKINAWSTATKIKIFMLTAGALVALGYNKETLKHALDSGISQTGTILESGLKIIQEHPGKATTALGIGAYGAAKLLQDKQPTIPSIADSVFSLLHDPELQQRDRYGNTNYNKYTENISWQLQQLLNKKNLPTNNEYQENLTALQQLNNSEKNYEITKDIKEELKRLNTKFADEIESKRKEFNMPQKGYFWLTLEDIFDTLYAQ